MSKRDVGYAIDIILACQDIQNFIQGKKRQDLEEDALLQAAILRKLEIIGEVAKRFSIDFKEKHAIIPWRNWAGLRDRPIHGYADINLDIVWNVLTTAVPVLVVELKKYEKENY